MSAFHGRIAEEIFADRKRIAAAIEAARARVLATVSVAEPSDPTAAAARAHNALDRELADLVAKLAKGEAP